MLHQRVEGDSLHATCYSMMLNHAQSRCKIHVDFQVVRSEFCRYVTVCETKPWLMWRGYWEREGDEMVMVMVILIMKGSSFAMLSQIDGQMYDIYLFPAPSCLARRTLLNARLEELTIQTEEASQSGRDWKTNAFRNAVADYLQSFRSFCWGDRTSFTA